MLQRLDRRGAVLVAVGNVEQDRACFEEGDLAFFIGRDLTEGIEGEMSRLLHLGAGQEADFIRPADFLQRPANSHVTGQPLTAIGRVCKGGYGDGHADAPKVI